MTHIPEGPRPGLSHVQIPVHARPDPKPAKPPLLLEPSAPDPKAPRTEQSFGHAAAERVIGSHAAPRRVATQNVTGVSPREDHIRARERAENMLSAFRQQAQLVLDALSEQPRVRFVDDMANIKNQLGIGDALPVPPGTEDTRRELGYLMFAMDTVAKRIAAGKLQPPDFGADRWDDVTADDMQAKALALLPKLSLKRQVDQDPLFKKHGSRLRDYGLLEQQSWHYAAQKFATSPLGKTVLEGASAAAMFGNEARKAALVSVAHFFFAGKETEQNATQAVLVACAAADVSPLRVELATGPLTDAQLQAMKKEGKLADWHRASDKLVLVKRIPDAELMAAVRERAKTGALVHLGPTAVHQLLQMTGPEAAPGGDAAASIAQHRATNDVAAREEAQARQLARLVAAMLPAGRIGVKVAQGAAARNIGTVTASAAGALSSAVSSDALRELMGEKLSRRDYLQSLILTTVGLPLVRQVLSVPGAITVGTLGSVTAVHAGKTERIPPEELAWHFIAASLAVCVTAKADVPERPLLLRQDEASIKLKHQLQFEEGTLITRDYANRYNSPAMTLTVLARKVEKDPEAAQRLAAQLLERIAATPGYKHYLDGYLGPVFSEQGAGAAYRPSDFLVPTNAQAVSELETVAASLRSITSDPSKFSLNGVVELFERGWKAVGGDAYKDRAAKALKSSIATNFAKLEEVLRDAVKKRQASVH